MGTKATRKLMYSFFVGACILFSVVTALGAFNPNPLNSPFRAYVAILIIAFLVVNIFFIVYWAWKKKVWAFVHLAAILINWGFLSAMIQIRFGTDDSKPDFRIMTYNVHSFNNDFDGYTARKIAEYIKNEGVDVVCFQEFSGNDAFTLDSLKDVFKEYKYRVIPIHRNGGTDLAVLSKYPITNAHFFPFYHSYNSAMYCDIIASDKKPVRIFNMHMQTTSFNNDIAQRHHWGLDPEQTLRKIEYSLIQNDKLRTKQAEYMIEKVNATDGRIIVAGDFNSQPSSFVYKIFSTNLTDEFKRCGSGYGYTYNDLWGLLRIDYIYTHNGVSALKYYSKSEKWSDHNPVFMNVKLD